MGVGVGGGGFGVRGGVNASTRGVGAGVGVGPFSTTGGCGASTIVWLIGVLVALLFMIFLVPILIALAALVGLWMIYRESRRDGTPFPVAMGVGLGMTAVACGGFGVWLWATTIDNSHHSTEVPEVSALNVAEAQRDLKAAGFSDVRIDVGEPTTGLNLADCEVSGTEPGQFLDADNRDPITIKGWCSDDARTIPASPTPVADTPTPSPPDSAVATTSAFCTLLVDYFNSHEMDEAQMQASSDDILARMDAFDALLPGAQGLVSGLPESAPDDVRQALIEHAKNVKSVSETGWMTSGRPFIRSKPIVAYAKKEC